MYFFRMRDPMWTRRRRSSRFCSRTACGCFATSAIFAWARIGWSASTGRCASATGWCCCSRRRRCPIERRSISNGPASIWRGSRSTRSRSRPASCSIGCASIISSMRGRTGRARWRGCWGSCGGSSRRRRRSRRRSGSTFSNGARPRRGRCPRRCGRCARRCSIRAGRSCSRRRRPRRFATTSRPISHRSDWDGSRNGRCRATISTSGSSR